MTICAWCLKEQGEAANDGDSHGICPPHAEEMVMNYHWNRLQNTPSYVEQNAAQFAAEAEEIEIAANVV